MALNSARSEGEGHCDGSATALQLSDRGLGQLVECIADGIIIHQDDRVIYANPAALAQLGVKSLAELVGYEMLDLVAPEDRSKIQAFNHRLFAKGALSAGRGSAAGNLMAP